MQGNLLTLSSLRKRRILPNISVQPDDRGVAYHGRLLALCLAVLLALRIAVLYITDTDLFFDEAQYWVWSQEPAFGYFSKPPLIAWIIGITTDICGMSEFCVRLASPILHSVTALFVFFAGQALFGSRIGFWSALAFITLPAVSLSAGLISTDVPLLTCWAFALLAWTKLLESRSWAWAVALGVAIGAGLLAKYAMIYFVLCAALFLAAEPSARWLLRDPRGLVAGAIAAFLIAPNILWNIDNGLATFSHTAANAKWSGSLFHPLKALEFIGAQFGVFGPVLFATFLLVAWRAVRGDKFEALRVATPLPNAGRMLFFFSAPVVLIVTVQALVSRAHANWAAAAYPAATILVTAILLQEQHKRWFQSSLGIHIAAFIAIGAGMASAKQLSQISPVNPFKRVLGWEALAEATKDKLKNREFAVILTDDRSVSAELIYYLREIKPAVLAWRATPVPRNHFELTRPFIGEKTQEPILFVTLRPGPSPVIRRFRIAEPLGEEEIPSGGRSKRNAYFYALSEYRHYESR